MLRRKRRGIKPSARINQVTSITDADEKLKALEAARLQIEKQFGQGSLMKLGAKTESNGIDVIPSGSILLDEALGIGGYPLRPFSCHATILNGAISPNFLRKTLPHSD